MVDENTTPDESAPRYETKSVTTVRGLEARSRSKWESAGWEFVSQDEGMLRTTLQFRRPKKLTPRWVWIAGGSVAALAVVAIVLGSVFGDGDTKADASAPTATATAASISVPDVSGLAGDKAKKNITDAGLAVKWDAGDESVWVASNWMVLEQSPKAGTRAAKDATVTLKVEPKAEETATPTSTAPPEQTESAEPAAPAQAANTTPSGLDFGWASTACQQYGEQEFPYGFKGHTLIGLLAQEVRGDEIYLKFEADITNGFGAERKANVECSVGGTNGSPNVTYFIAY
ncbi:PASTA domain-containing protein [Curtobacterium sp. PhB78]|uniref:PASTA domain-containing protein n=1 Tax=Curtobacterium sp. PhB78 TaxID=2485102 RepID=UPI000F464DA2|nr:PASTA domain-containing protein [Curtobacterium sp. PhB78]ROS46177.1 PASTA domain-containing protein [Curtobacterium sp. PhB78]